MTPPVPATLSDRLLARDPHALARAISLVENETEQGAFFLLQGGESQQAEGLPRGLVAGAEDGEGPLTLVGPLVLSDDEPLHRR